MKERRWIAVFLVMAMLLTLLSGCGSGGASSVDGDSGNSQSQVSQESEGAEAEDSKTGDSSEDVYTVRVMNIHTAKTEDCEEVAAYISEMTRELVGANVEIIPGVTAEQVNLALTSGEKWICCLRSRGSHL